MGCSRPSLASSSLLHTFFLFFFFCPSKGRKNLLCSAESIAFFIWEFDLSELLGGSMMAFPTCLTYCVPTSFYPQNHQCKRNGKKTELLFFFSPFPHLSLFPRKLTGRKPSTEPDSDRCLSTCPSLIYIYIARLAWRIGCCGWERGEGRFANFPQKKTNYCILPLHNKLYGKCHSYEFLEQI